MKETGDEKARTKSAPEPHIPVEPNALYTHTHTSHIFSTHRAHVAFPVNVLSGRQRRRRPRRYGGGFGGGSEGIAVTRRQGRMVVTRTGHCHPLAIADTTSPPPPMQNHPLSRSMGNYFLSVDYGVNFRTTKPDHFERDTTSIRDVSGKRCRMNIVTNVTFSYLLRITRFSYN